MRQIDRMPERNEAMEIHGVAKLLEQRSGIQGYLTIEIYKGEPEEGRLVDRISHFNTLTTISIQASAALAVGCVGSPAAITSPTSGSPVAVAIAGNPDRCYITKMRWGSGGATPANAADTNLTTPFGNVGAGGDIIKSVSVTYPSATSVQCSATLGTSDANGLSLSEEGLFMAGTGNSLLLFAHATFGVLTKASGFSFTFNHLIQF